MELYDAFVHFLLGEFMAENRTAGKTFKMKFKSKKDVACIGEPALMRKLVLSFVRREMFIQLLQEPNMHQESKKVVINVIASRYRENVSCNGLCSENFNLEHKLLFPSRKEACTIYILAYSHLGVAEARAANVMGQWVLLVFCEIIDIIQNQDF
eukprot:NODE_265_length_12372_cov_0.450012.p8 type:complete len:154 gc:universal NODE_265_length_12372_cov_0.450012:5486-5025(-)